jgi:hypothetical protein
VAGRAVALTGGEIVARISAFYANQNRESGCFKMNTGKLEPDPLIAKVLFGVLLTVLVVSEAALYSGLATVPETWPLN